MTDSRGGVPDIDFFGMFSDIGKTLQQNRLRSTREQALAPLRDGGSVIDASKALFAAGDFEGGLSLAKLGDAQAMRDWQKSTDQRDFDHRVTESTRAQTNADRSFGLQTRQLDASLEGAKVPPGFTRGPDGGLSPVPGGPSDPAYLQRAADAKAKPREFSVSDVTKLSDEGGKFANVSGFVNTFEPRFAGYKSQTLGNMANTAGRYTPSLAPKDAIDGSAWWQGYDKYKNTVRHDLFGSALTATEQAQWDRADINPGMDPAQIKKNLEVQNAIVKNGLKRKANALIQSGYDPKAISASYGLDLSELGVTAQGRRGGAPGAPSGVPSPPGSGRRAPPEAIADLKRNPQLSEQFDEMYGVGSAARALGVLR